MGFLQPDVRHSRCHGQTFVKRPSFLKKSPAENCRVFSVFASNYKGLPAKDDFSAKAVKLRPLTLPVAAIGSKISFARIVERTGANQTVKTAGFFKALAKFCENSLQ